MVHKQAGGAGASGASAQKQLQGAQMEAPCYNLAGGGSRVIDAFVTTGAGQQDTREVAVARAAPILDNAKKCPVCQRRHLFDVRKRKRVQFPLTWLDSCKKFKEQSPKRKAIILEEQSGCLLCTSFVHKRETYQHTSHTMPS